jgi:hypothetical protein
MCSNITEKGMQIDEFHNTNSGKFKRRQFNCWLNVVPYQDNFKVYQIKIDKHVDDYVLKEAKAIKKLKLHRKFS